jgi:hypothetical protein
MAPPILPMQLLAQMGGQAPQGQTPPQSPMGGMMPPSGPQGMGAGNGGMGGPFPQQAGQQDPMMQQLMQGSQMGQQAFTEQLQRTRALADTVGQLQKQQAALQVPQMGPQIDPQKSTLHNIGQILLMALSPVGAGAAVYGPGKQAYAAKSGALAEQIKELQGQEQVEEQPMSAAAGLQYHPFQAAGAMMRGQAAETTAGANVMNAQTKALAEQHKLTLQTEANRIKQELGQGKLTQEAARTQMMGLIAQETNATRKDVANIFGSTREGVEQQQAAEEDFKTESDHVLQSILGFSPQKPVQPAAPRSAKPAAKGGATHVFVPGKGLQPVSNQ